MYFLLLEFFVSYHYCCMWVMYLRGGYMCAKSVCVAIKRRVWSWFSPSAVGSEDRMWVTRLAQGDSISCWAMIRIDSLVLYVSDLHKFCHIATERKLSKASDRCLLPGTEECRHTHVCTPVYIHTHMHAIERLIIIGWNSFPEPISVLWNFELPIQRFSFASQ